MSTGEELGEAGAVKLTCCCLVDISGSSAANFSCSLYRLDLCDLINDNDKVENEVSAAVVVALDRRVSYGSFMDDGILYDRIRCNEIGEGNAVVPVFGDFREKSSLLLLHVDDDRACSGDCFFVFD